MSASGCAPTDWASTTDMKVLKPGFSTKERGRLQEIMRPFIIASVMAFLDYSSCKATHFCPELKDSMLPQTTLTFPLLNSVNLQINMQNMVTVTSWTNWRQGRQNCWIRLLSFCNLLV